MGKHFAPAHPANAKGSKKLDGLWAPKFRLKKPSLQNALKSRLSTSDALATPAQEPDSRPTPAAAQKITRYIRGAHKRVVWKRDQGQCRDCGTTAQLEQDHIITFALGGPTQLGNLGLQCRACDAAAAIQAFSFSHMERARVANQGRKSTCV